LIFLQTMSFTEGESTFHIPAFPRKLKGILYANIS